MTHGSRADGIDCMYSSDRFVPVPVFFTSTIGVVPVTVTVSSTDDSTIVTSICEFRPRRTSTSSWTTVWKPSSANVSV